MCYINYLTFVPTLPVLMMLLSLKAKLNSCATNPVLVHIYMYMIFFAIPGSYQ